jgi:hypothetical protein
MSARDLAATLAMFATWAGVCLIAVVRPEVDALTAMAAAAAIAVTCALTPHDSPTTRKDVRP